MNSIALFLIKVYRKFISPMTPPHCRYIPTCSEYALEAYKKYNFFKATYLSLWRLIRCNPFSKGGFDPVP